MKTIVAAVLMSLSAMCHAGDAKSQAISPSLIAGVVDGCIDGQKRRFETSYKGNEELVRQYCFCMSPVLASAAAEEGGIAKILDGDKTLKARVQKIHGICEYAVLNGRRFTSPLQGPRGSNKKPEQPEYTSFVDAGAQPVTDVSGDLDRKNK